MFFSRYLLLIVQLEEINIKIEMKPTLFILAAGIGSRYGGLKQLEKLGPNGELLMDYSVYDAIKAGFGKIVFVIRKPFEKDFRNHIKKYEGLIDVELVFQDVSKIPTDIELNPVRERPWGTSQALLMGAEVIHEPFGVINADDFYGRESFQLLCGQLRAMGDSKHEYCMIGYRLGNTVVESGSVARAICKVDEDNMLTKIEERQEVQRIDAVPSYKDEDGEWVNLTDTTLISMNMWGFTPDIFDLDKKYFTEFLLKNKDDIKAEFLIPGLINDIIVNGDATIKLINTPAKWFGITYVEDKPDVVHRLRELIADDVYPHKLF